MAITKVTRTLLSTGIDDQSNATAITIDSSENVGIGQTSPIRPIHLSTSSGGSIIHLTDDSTGHTATDGVDIQQEGTLFQILNREAGDIRFGTNATERMRIDSSGAVLFKSGAFPTNQDSPFIYRIGGGSLAIGAATETGTSAHAAFYTNSLERMRINSSGNVGIGATPSAYNSSYRAIDISNSASVMGYTGNNGAWLMENLYYGTDNNWKHKNSDFSALVEMYDGVFNFFNTASGTAGATATLQNRLTINQSGNVGIGITSPAYKLDLNGDMRFTTGSALFWADTNVYEGRTGNDRFWVTGGSERMRIDSSGNLLHGTTGTSWTNTAGTYLFYQSALNVTRDGAESMNLNRLSSDGDILSFRKDGTPVGSIGGGATFLTIGSGTGNVYFQNGVMAPTASSGGASSNGVIDLGTSSSRFKDLYLSGKVTINGSSNDGLDVSVGSNRLVMISKRGNDGDHIRFLNSAGTISGNISVSGTSTAYGTSSDYRLKENVDYDFNALDRVAQLKPARFNFIADADTTVDGFLAHEVQDIVPEAIQGEKDAVREEEYEVTPAVLDDDGNVVTEAEMGTREVPDYQGIDQSKLVPLLTKAIQEQQTIIDNLTTRIETLENA